MPQVTLKGNPVQLVGAELKVGDKAPDFNLQTTALEEVSLSSYAGTTRIIATIPSLDTSVCHLETKRFNEEAAQLQGVSVLVVSTDLPFGQKRWCGAENVESVKTLSDHRTAEFGKSYGVLIQGGGLDRCFARAVFVIGADDTIKHVEYCSEIASHPDYDAVLAAARA
ncbi:MAG TPA: thiol peroxidase [Planctomicrobium sp.]|nr:thiol peroxidase [Planctomicrobium sp.]